MISNGFLPRQETVITTHYGIGLSNVYYLFSMYILVKLRPLLTATRQQGCILYPADQIAKVVLAFVDKTNPQLPLLHKISMIAICWKRVLVCFLPQKGGKIIIPSLQSCHMLFWHFSSVGIWYLLSTVLWLFSNQSWLLKIKFILICFDKYAVRQARQSIFSSRGSATFL